MRSGVRVKLLQSCLFVTPWTAARQAPLSMGFSRQEYWSGLLCPPQGDLPDPGTDPCLLHRLPWQAGSLPLGPLEKPQLRASVLQLRPGAAK